jgi:hypothetical protein
MKNQNQDKLTVIPSAIKTVIGVYRHSATGCDDVTEIETMYAIAHEAKVEHAALVALADAALIVLQSGPLANGLRDENSLKVLRDAYANYAAIRSGH